MEDRVFSVEEVNASFELAGMPRWLPDEPGLEWSQYGMSGYLWSTGIGSGEIGERRRIAALALGVLPEGWMQSDSGEGYIYRPGIHTVGQISMRRVWFEDWPEAVRSGQAEIACRLLAAHVELERLRAGGVK